jgi:hypothetical protein
MQALSEGALDMLVVNAIVLVSDVPADKLDPVLTEWICLKQAQLKEQVAVLHRLIRKVQN